MIDPNLDADLRKGKCTRDQLRIWDQLLEIRIQLQKIISETNTLPQNGFQKYIDNEEEESQSFVDSLKNNNDSVRKLLDNLLDLQDSMVKQNPEITAKGRKTKGGDKNGETVIASDEEITSSEDEEEDSKNPEDLDVDDEEEKGSEEGSEDEKDEELEDEDENEDEDEGVVEKKRRVVEDYEAEVEKRLEEFSGYRDETIQKWNDKTQVASGNLKRNYAAFQTSTLNQVNHILKDTSRLIKRTQLKRSQYNIIGKDNVDQDGKEVESEYDPEIFDDDDFYHQLLRELIDRKTSNVTDPVQLSRHWLQIQKLRSKLKRNVDTRASKGRKIRYDVHPKLVNFMASYDNSEMTENAINELMSSLFGNQK
jgi:protein AATF/BFR2